MGLVSLSVCREEVLSSNRFATTVVVFESIYQVNQEAILFLVLD
jgi:hypothetical protein